MPARLPWLDVADVAKILGEEAERQRQLRRGTPEADIDVAGAAPLSEQTVLTYARLQRKPEESQRKAVRAFPPPVYQTSGSAPKSGHRPVWPIPEGGSRADVEWQFRRWYRTGLGPDRRTTADRPWLDVADVAKILGQEAERRRQIRQGIPEGDIDVTGAKPLAEQTVRTYMYRVRHPGGRRQYEMMLAEGRTFPPPVYSSGNSAPSHEGDRPVWPIPEGGSRADVEWQFRRWYRSRPGQGVGGGRPWNRVQTPDPTRPAPVPDEQQTAASRPRRPRRPR